MSRYRNKIETMEFKYAYTGNTSRFDILNTLAKDIEHAINYIEADVDIVHTDLVWGNRQR